MHFAKTYSQLLLTLPTELQGSAIQYRQLKKLINELVAELEGLGLTPDVLQDLLQGEDTKRISGSTSSSTSDLGEEPTSSKGKGRARGERPLSLASTSERSSVAHRPHTLSLPLLSVALPASVNSNAASQSEAEAGKVVYELSDEKHVGEIHPQLRLWLRENESAVGRGSDLKTYARVELVEDEDEDGDGDEDDSEDGHGGTKAEPANEVDIRKTGQEEASGGSAHHPDSPSLPDASSEPSTTDSIIAMTPLVSHKKRELLWELQERRSMLKRNRDSTWTGVPIERELEEYDIAEQDKSSTSIPREIEPDTTVPQTVAGPVEVVIPLASDTAFFRLLINALESLSVALTKTQEDLRKQIAELAKIVGDTSRPASAGGKSDLYTWRAIFQLYMESQVFESTSERDRGERSIEDVESRLALFARRVGEGGFKFHMTGSRNALERFLELNVKVMNIKKFLRANAEAARKILKKKVKRTALPLPPTANDLIPVLELGKATASIPHVLIVSLTESLMPVIPIIDDYVCSICTSIAYKPIKLNCGHLFCVRCLVKMQKAGKDNCPMCRAPTVLVADRRNLDVALSNFMLDWFPVETKEKAKSNDLESTKEQMEELGIDGKCLIM